MIYNNISYYGWRFYKKRGEHKYVLEWTSNGRGSNLYYELDPPNGLSRGHCFQGLVINARFNLAQYSSVTFKRIEERAPEIAKGWRERLDYVLNCSCHPVQNKNADDARLCWEWL